MSAEFLDSNVLLYLFDETADAKRAVAERLVAEGIESGDACISYQVVQETLAVLSGKLERVATPAATRKFFEDVLEPLWVIGPSPGLFRRGLDLQERYGFAFYDALIVAAALEAGCTRLWSEDLQHGQRIDRLTIANPFAPRAKK